MNESLSRLSILGCRFFLFITLYVLCQPLLTCRVSAEKSVDSLMGLSLYVICCFSLALLIFSLYLWVDSVWDSL